MNRRSFFGAALAALGLSGTKREAGPSPECQMRSIPVELEPVTQEMVDRIKAEWERGSAGIQRRPATASYNGLLFRNHGVV